MQARSCAKGGPAPFGYPRHETQVSLDASSQRELPLWIPYVRGTLFPFNPLANETNPVSLDASLKKMI